MRRALPASSVLACALLAAARAAEPVVHAVDSARELLAGDADGVAVDPLGRALPGPSFETLAAVPEAVVWCLAVDDGGRIYLGTGHDGRVLATGKGASGELEVVLDTDEVEVTALAHDGDALYAATSPDGKVYRVEGGKSTVLFDPDDRYIWSLLVDGKELYVGTGSQARVHRVARDGTSSVVFTSTERNVTSLARAGSALFAGTDDHGKLYRIGADGNGFAVWDSALREVASLSMDAEGRVLAAAIDIARAGAPPAATPPAAPVPGAAPVDDAAAAAVRLAPPAPPPAAPGKASSEVVRIETRGERAGVVEPLALATDEPVMRILAGPSGTVLLAGAAGTAARLSSLDPGSGTTVLARLKEGQVTALARLPDGGVAVATSNPGGLYRLGAATARKGSLLGAVVDAGAVARFGVVTFTARQPAGSSVRVRVRSGNTVEPGPDWTPWSDPLPDGGRVPGGPARFLQWRADFATGEGDAPWLERLTVTSVQENVAPVVESVSVLPPGLVFRPSSLPPEPASPGLPDDRDLFSLNLPDLAEPPAAQGTRRLEFRRGMRTLVWTARDGNGDRLACEVTLTREESSPHEPISLRKDLRADWYTFDTTSLPDGVYRAEVVASDRASNGVSRALTGRRGSAAFDVDNTPPRVRATLQDGAVTVQASDAGGLLKAYASVAGGAWQPIASDDGVSDGKDETYRIDPASLAEDVPSGALVLVKVFDRAGNVGADAVTVSAAP